MKGARVRTESCEVWFIQTCLFARTQVPSPESFAEYLTSLAHHPSGLLTSLTSLAERVHIAVAAESTSYALCRVGRFRGELCIETKDSY